MVDHYPLFEFPACSKIIRHDNYKSINVCIKASYNKNNIIMLCSFGTSTEASAPAVLSFIFSSVIDDTTCV